MTRIFNGFQPTGTLHIGNYLGAIIPWHQAVNKSEEPQALICVVDQHAITIHQDPEVLKRKTYEMAAIMLASGVDPKKHIIFVQSQNPDHAYTSWMFNCLTPMGWLDRMTQFKEKKEKVEGYREAVSTGLYTYPALMAADILLYDADLVPVGVDQKQHVELTADIANRFNSLYGGTTLKVPKFYTMEETTKLYDLQDPTKKMSKSDADDAGRISLTDTADIIRKKIMKAVTDGESVVAYDVANKAGISNLLAIFSAVTEQKIEKIASEYSDKGYGVFKSAVADAVIAYLEPFQAKMSQFLEDKGQLRMILDDGAARAYELSHPKALEIANKIGLYVHA